MNINSRDSFFMTLSSETEIPEQKHVYMECTLEDASTLSVIVLLIISKISWMPMNQMLYNFLCLMIMLCFASFEFMSSWLLILLWKDMQLGIFQFLFIINSYCSQPHLYVLVITLQDPSGDVIECESCQVGIRQVSKAPKQLLVNGQTVIIRGVNRHEHHPRLGKTNMEACMVKVIFDNSISL